MNWFDYKGKLLQLSGVEPPPHFDTICLDYALYKWLRENTYDRVAFVFSGKPTDEAEEPNIWKERKDAKTTLQTYLNDFPSEIIIECACVAITEYYPLPSDDCGYTWSSWCGQRQSHCWRAEGGG